MRIRAVTISSELVERLEAFTPSVAPADTIKWQNYRIGGLPKPLPVVFKGPLDGPLLPGEVYDIVVCTRKGGRGSHEAERPTLDHYEIKCGKSESLAPAHELRFVQCPVDHDFFFTGEKPVEVVRLKGLSHRAVLFFVAVGARTAAVAEKETIEVVFQKPCLVQLPPLAEEKLFNPAVRLIASVNGENGSERLVIYDHRTNRKDPFALVQKVRKAIGRRTFEFWNIRDFTGDRNEIASILTETGLTAL